jgi:hypothetical protein
MVIPPIDENLEDVDRSAPDLGFNGSVSLKMAICEHCKWNQQNEFLDLRDLEMESVKPTREDDM